MKEIKNENIIDINILLALSKCLGEMSHNLQYVLTQIEKKRVKDVIRSNKLLETTLDKRFEGSQKDAVESIYDVIMDLILDAREVSLENIKEQRASYDLVDGAYVPKE
jgi:hypothetical protein